MLIAGRHEHPLPSTLATVTVGAALHGPEAEEPAVHVVIERLEDQPLPANLGHEAVLIPPAVPLPELINTVTDTISFPVRGDDPTRKREAAQRAKFKRYFTSPESTAVLHDAFWFILSQYFKGDVDKSEPQLAQQEAVFNRMASSFVQLLFAVDNGFKDIFFEVLVAQIEQG